MRITFVSGKFLPDAPRQLDPVEAGHDQVCDYEVRPLTSHERRGLPARFSFPYDDDRVRHRTEEGSDHLAVVGCVVGHDDGHRHRPAPSVRTGRELNATGVPDHACSHGVDLQYEDGAAGNNLLTLSEHQERKAAGERKVRNASRSLTARGLLPTTSLAGSSGAPS